MECGKLKIESLLGNAIKLWQSGVLMRVNRKYIGSRVTKFKEDDEEKEAEPVRTRSLLLPLLYY